MNLILPIAAPLASAQATDFYSAQGVEVLVGFAIAAGTALFVIVPVAIAGSRRHRQRQSIIAASVLWGLATGITTSMAAIGRMRWSKEWLLMVKTGYYDPQDLSGQPAWPWAIWAGLAMAYCGLCFWSSRRRPEAKPH